MFNDWSHKVRAILKKYCPGNIKKNIALLVTKRVEYTILFWPPMDNNMLYGLQERGHDIKQLENTIYHIHRSLGFIIHN